MGRIHRLLVANRGEIAARVMRTARSMDITTVAVFSDPDAQAPFVRAADESVHLPGSAPADTYLRIDRILAAAQATGADAIHPGYGFLSESAAFARACEQAGLVFVGPPAHVIDAMGSKVAAKELMAAAGVPVLSGVTVDDDAAVGAGLADRVAAQIGFPVLVKAAFGGGGRGMRVVHSPDALADAVAGARREAVAAFGDGTVFVERYLPAPRHVEVQIFGDRQGQVVHLFERECSIQRRYQKIIEESPSPAVDDALRCELGAAAVSAARSIGYVGAGTVEFVLDEDRRFYFLEVNTRLQVEHPVTEEVTGLDLVRLQLHVAEGHPLPPEVTAATVRGHSVEARLYAEEVGAGFLPATGTVHRFAVPSLPGVRVDAGVADGSVVGPHYDPMLAKVIATAPTREQACRLLARALEQTRLHGVVSNRELLVAILREPEFLSGAIDTGYLTRHDPATLERSGRDRAAVPVHALAAALAGQAGRRAAAPVLASLPSGWRNVPNSAQQAVFRCDGSEVTVGYRLAGTRLEAQVDQLQLGDLVLHSATAQRVDLAVGGVRRAMSVHRVGDTAYVDSVLGSTVLTEVPRFAEPGSQVAPGSLLAPMPGTVVRVGVADGDRVRSGAPIVVLEAMKMEHTVNAPRDGVVTGLAVTVGQTVEVGTVLAVVADDE